MKLQRIASFACRSSLIVSSLIALSACAQGPDKDYDSAAACADQGLHAGTDEYEKCMTDEKAARALESQQQEYDQMKWEQDYYRNQRATY